MLETALTAEYYWDGCFTKFEDKVAENICKSSQLCHAIIVLSGGEQQVSGGVVHLHICDCPGENIVRSKRVPIGNCAGEIIVGSSKEQVA